MFKLKRYIPFLAGVAIYMAACKVPAILNTKENRSVPTSYDNNGGDTTNTSVVSWRSFFTDQHLIDLIDTALKNNQELNITLQEIEMARNDIRIRQGALLPSISARAGAGVEKVGRYTSQGAGDATTEIKPGVEMPDPLTDLTIAAY